MTCPKCGNYINHFLCEECGHLILGFVFLAVLSAVVFPLGLAGFYVWTPDWSTATTTEFVWKIVAAFATVIFGLALGAITLMCIWALAIRVGWSAQQASAKREQRRAKAWAEAERQRAEAANRS